MDPNATVRRILDAPETDPEEERDACEDLEHWLHGGGFVPTESVRELLIHLLSRAQNDLTTLIAEEG